MRGVKVKAERNKAKRAIRAMAEIAKAKVDALEEKVRFMAGENQGLRAKVAALELQLENEKSLQLAQDEEFCASMQNWAVKLSSVADSIEAGLRFNSEALVKTLRDLSATAVDVAREQDPKPQYFGRFDE